VKDRRLDLVYGDLNDASSINRILRTVRPDEIYNLFFDSPLTADFEKGKVSPSEFYAQVKEILSLGISYDSFLPIWNEIFFLSAKNRAVYHIANLLKENYRVALISNINILHYEYLRENFPIFNIFEKLFLSYEMGLVKPDIQIYQKVIAALQVEPQEIFYTDDRQELVESAKPLGLKSFVFKSAEALTDDLSSCGIKFEFV